MSAEDIAAPFASRAARAASAIVSGILVAHGQAELPPHLTPAPGSGTTDQRLLESGTNWGRRLWLAGGSGWPCLVCRVGVHPNPTSAAVPYHVQLGSVLELIDTRTPES